MASAAGLSERRSTLIHHRKHATGEKKVLRYWRYWNGGGKMQRRAGWVGGVIGYLWVSKGPVWAAERHWCFLITGMHQWWKGFWEGQLSKEECREGDGLMRVCLFCPHARIGLDLSIYPSSVALCTITPSFFHLLSVSPWLGSLGSVENLQVIISLKAQQKGTWLDFSSPEIQFKTFRSYGNGFTTVQKSSSWLCQWKWLSGTDLRLISHICLAVFTVLCNPSLSSPPP